MDLDIRTSMLYEHVKKEYIDALRKEKYRNIQKYNLLSGGGAK